MNTNRHITNIWTPKSIRQNVSELFLNYKALMNFQAVG